MTDIVRKEPGQGVGRSAGVDADHVVGMYKAQGGPGDGFLLIEMLVDLFVEIVGFLCLGQKRAAVLAVDQAHLLQELLKAQLLEQFPHMQVTALDQSDSAAEKLHALAARFPDRLTVVQADFFEFKTDARFDAVEQGLGVLPEAVPHHLCLYPERVDRDEIADACNEEQDGDDRPGARRAVSPEHVAEIARRLP